MIPIKYDLTDANVQTELNNYNTFILKFKKNLDRAIQKGKYNENGNVIAISEKDKNILTWFSTHLTSIANMNASYMKNFIKKMENEFGIREGTSIHSHIKHMFVKNGYDGGKFPKEALVKAVNIDTCPYCNRQNVGYVEVKKRERGRLVTKSIKGELDHFYYKEKYPYLAISRNNLVPCCHDCNVYPNKHTEDVVATNLVNPYEETSYNTLLFRIEVPLEAHVGIIKEKQAEITFDTSANHNYKKNINTFSLKDLYNEHHINEATNVYNIYIYTKNQNYQRSIDDMTESLNTITPTTYQMFKESCGVVSDPSKYKKNILSKMKTDIWNQLESGL